MLDCVLLVVPSVNKHAKLVHHPMIDMITPLNPNGRLMGMSCGPLLVMVLPLCQCSCWTPSSVRFRACAPPSWTWPQQASSQISLASCPPVGLMMRGLELPFHHKRPIVLPPSLAKAFMDVDMEDVAELAMVGCKVLQDFDAQWQCLANVEQWRNQRTVTLRAMMDPPWLKASV